MSDGGIWANPAQHEVHLEEEGLPLWRHILGIAPAALIISMIYAGLMILPEFMIIPIETRNNLAGYALALFAQFVIPFTIGAGWVLVARSQANFGTYIGAAGIAMFMVIPILFLIATLPGLMGVVTFETTSYFQYLLLAILVYFMTTPTLIIGAWVTRMLFVP